MFSYTRCILNCNNNAIRMSLFCISHVTSSLKCDQKLHSHLQHLIQFECVNDFPSEGAANIFLQKKSTSQTGLVVCKIHQL